MKEEQQEVGPTFLPSMSTTADIYFIGTRLSHSVVTLHGEAEEHRHIIEWLIFHFPKTITVQPWQTKLPTLSARLVRLQLNFKHDLDILDQPDLSHQVVCE